MGKFKGYFFAALAAASYGTNPAFAIPLYDDGMDPNSVLLFRYILGLPFLILLLRVRKIGFRMKKDEIVPVFILGILMALSSLTLFESYRFMNSGIASTLLFVYPVLVAVIMVFFFHEQFRISIVLCLLLMCAGLALLARPEPGESLSGYGFLLVMLSAIVYALYIVLVNVNRRIAAIPTTKLLFYVLIFGSLVFLFKIAIGSEVTVPQRPVYWLNLLALAIIPTILSLACTSMAIHLIGSTGTAIFGALEPVTAVVLGILILGQGVTVNEIIGGVLIVVATTIVVASKNVDRFILHVRKMFPKHHRHPDPS